MRLGKDNRGPVRQLYRADVDVFGTREVKSHVFRDVGTSLSLRALAFAVEANPFFTVQSYHSSFPFPFLGHGCARGPPKLTLKNRF